MNVAANYDPNGVPTPMTPTPDPIDGSYGDIILFDGKTTGPLSVTQSGGGTGGFGGQAYPAGLRIFITSNQTAPVTIYSVVSVSGGLRMNYFECQPGSGGLILGDGSLNCFDILDGELNGQITGLTNNSSVPAVVTESVRWREGGAGAHPHIFAGTGDWIVRNHMRSANQSSILVQKFGPGTMTWTGTNVPNANFPDALGPITIGEGTMIWKTSDLVGGSAGNPGIANDALWKYDANDGGTCLVLGTVSGAGILQVNAGTLNLSGANIFTGNINLTGGELIAGRAEVETVSGPLGLGGLISFNGGTLGWSVANSFDYSSRFDTAANQQYSFDTRGVSPSLATGLGSSGGTLTKLGGGTLTLAGANSYSGLTTVSGGELLFQGTKTGTGNITVNDGAAFGLVENGSQITPNTLTLGTSAGAILEFNNVTNKTAAPLSANNLVSAGTVTINVNNGNFFTIGDTFPLLKWTSGSAPAVTLGFLGGAGGHLITNINEIDLVIDDPPYIWTGLNGGTWDAATINWTQSGVPAIWVNGHFALLDNSSSVTNLALSGIITPTNATINNGTGSVYAITNSPGNIISGGGSLTKNGNGTLLLPGGANDYTGVTTVGGGILSAGVLANGGTASDIGAASAAAANLVLNGGALQYTGSGATIDRLFTLGRSGGTIDNEGAGALVLNSTGTIGTSGSGPRGLTLAGPDIGVGNTLAPNIVDGLGGGTALTKNGTSLWILTGTNTHSGVTTIGDGVLQIGAAGPSGTIGNGSIVNNGAIVFNRTGTLTVGGAISGTGSVTNDGTGTVILANNSTYTGGTTINAGTLQVGNGGGSGSLDANGPIVNNSLLDFNTSGSFSYSGGGIISGTGNVIARGGGVIKVVGNNTYSGWTRIDANTIFWPREGQDGGLVSSVVTNNGTLRLLEQNSPGLTYAGPIVGSGRVQIGANNVNAGQIVFTGTNTYTGGTFIGDNELILGDGLNPGLGSYNGNVQFVNNFTVAQDNLRRLSFNRPDDVTFSGNITANFTTPQANQGVVRQMTTARLTLTGNNTYGSGTVIDAGTLEVGNGGTAGTIGSGPVTDNGLLVFNRAGTLSVPGAISGAGLVAQVGSGTVVASGANNYTGATTISNGVLVLSGSVGVTLPGGDVMIEGGTLAPGGLGTVGTLTIGGNLLIDSGTVEATLNRTLVQSNSFVSLTNEVTLTTGTVTANAGTALKLVLGTIPVVGDKYTIFSQPVTGGAGMTMVTPGFTVANNLAVDGSVTVTATNPPPTLTFSVTGGTLNLSWPAVWTGGVHLQAQTNSLTRGLSSNWVTITGTDLSNVYSTSLNKSNQCVFYRLITP